MNWFTKRTIIVPIIGLIVIAFATTFSEALYIESKIDLVFESSTLLVLFYIYFIVTEYLDHNVKLRLGLVMLIVSKAYDTITEVEPIAQFFKIRPIIDSFLEDGTLQISYLLIAVGVTELTHILRSQNLKDDLTGLFNRKMLPQLPLDTFQMIYFDLDGLKAVNDSEGHHAGDRYIVTFAHALELCLNKDELAFRLGGDEFLVTLHRDRAEAFLAELNPIVEKHDVRYSYGIENGTKASIEEALSSSDKAMYKMKMAKREEP